MIIRNAVPDKSAGLVGSMSPLICTSAKEQAELGSHFERWFGHWTGGSAAFRAEQGAEPGPTGKRPEEARTELEGSSQNGDDTGGKDRRPRAKVALILVSVLLIT